MSGKALLMNAHNIGFCREINFKKLRGHPLLSGAMVVCPFYQCLHRTLKAIAL